MYACLFLLVVKGPSASLLHASFFFFASSESLSTEIKNGVFKDFYLDYMSRYF